MCVLVVVMGWAVFLFTRITARREDYRDWVCGGRLCAGAFLSGSRQFNIAGAITRCWMSKIRVRGGAGEALPDFMVYITYA